MKKWGLVILVSWWLVGCTRVTEEPGAGQVKSKFEECVEAGGVVLELSPRQCRDSQGNVFAEKKRVVLPDAGASRSGIQGDKEASEEASVCRDSCGNGVCEEVVCQAVGCPCSETAISCPQDCK